MDGTDGADANLPHQSAAAELEPDKEQTEVEQHRICEARRTSVLADLLAAGASIWADNGMPNWFVEARSRAS